MANFEDLSDDILYLILHCFHDQRLSALHSFRLVSKQLSAFADSVLYRVVVLEDQGEKREQATYRFIERLLDPTDILRSHVRSLHVKSFYGDDQSACMNVQLLAACLRSIEKLHAFSWGSEIPLPDDLLHALHRHHPDAQLCLSSRQFDQAALASSQLHRLSVSIPCFDLINPVSVAPFEQLRQILTNDSNIRRLSMDVHIDAEAHALPQGTYAARSTPDTVRLIVHDPRIFPRYILEPTDRINKIQLRLEPTDRLPSLEELVIKPHTYYFAREHCTRLYQCMDWTKLKRLKLGTSNSVAFLLTFTGKLPHLEHLDFSFHFKPEAYSPYFDRDRLVSCCDFMTSLNMLTVLIVRCDAIDLSNIFWHLLATTHGKRLQQLSLRSCFDALEAPSYRLSIRGFLTAFQNLTRLEVDFPTWNGPCYNFQGTPYSLDTGYITSIPFLPSLEILRMFMKVTLRNEQSLYQYINKHAHCAILQLWAFYADQPETCASAYQLAPYNLQVFSIQFWRWEPPSAHSFENGTSPFPHINKVVFDSMRQGHQLVVRARDGSQTVKTFYNSVFTDYDAPLTTYLPVEQAVPGHPFILPDALLGATERPFE